MRQVRCDKCGKTESLNGSGLPATWFQARWSVERNENTRASGDRVRSHDPDLCPDCAGITIELLEQAIPNRAREVPTNEH